MATATFGGHTATMTASTQAQADQRQRYITTLEALHDEMLALTALRLAETIDVAEYNAKYACLMDLQGQADAAWAALKPDVVWT